MKVGPLRLGSRTLKTALSVMLCILLFEFLDRDTPIIACLAAVFALRQDVSSTISFGIYRVAGNILGGSCAIVYFFIFSHLNYRFIVELILVPLIVIFIIVTADAVDYNAGIIGACATFFIIVLTVPEHETVWFALARITDTILGTLIALGVNYWIKPVQTPITPEISNEELLAELASKDAELSLLKAKLNELENRE